MAKTRSARLTEFFRRLHAATAARSRDEAFGQVFRLLNEVEDEFSGAPYNLASSMSAGRLYPPLWDNIRSMRGRPDVTRMLSVGHETLLGSNGAIRIVDRYSRTQIFSKPGEDGVEMSSL